MERLDIDRWAERASLGEHGRRAREELLALLANLVRVDVKTLGQLGQRGLPADGRESDLGLESRGVVTTGTTGHKQSSNGEGRKIVRGARLSS